MSPTIFRHGPFRFYFFSREEPGIHVHVETTDGEAKSWLDPEIELAKNYHLSSKAIRRAQRLIEEHEQEIRDAWHSHFQT